MVQLADFCDAALNTVIYDELYSNGLLTPNATLNKQELLNAIDAPDVIPEWAKQQARKAFDQIDLPKIAQEIAVSGVEKLKALLGR